LFWQQVNTSKLLPVKAVNKAKHNFVTIE